jgi:hypothetical protein
MSNTEKQTAHSAEPSVRDNWPKGIFGWIAYLIDHRIRGYWRPVDWGDLWSFEESISALYLSANGGVLVLDGAEVDALRLMAKGFDDTAITSSLRLRVGAVSEVRSKLSRHLGVSSAADLAQLAATHGARLT